MDLKELLERLTCGAGVRDESLLHQYDALPAELLAACLPDLGGHAGCDVAYVLARREDRRGVAELARYATQLATAHRALGYLDRLDMLDMVPPPLQTPRRRREAEVVDLLGSEPEWLDEVGCQTIRWPERSGPCEVRLFRFGYADLPSGAALLGPVPVRVDGGVDGLGDDDLLALLVGRCFIMRLLPLPAERVDPQEVENLLRRRVYYYLSNACLERAYELGSRRLLVIGARQRRGPGYLVGDPRGDLPTHWLPRPPGDSAGFTAEHAAWLWLGRFLSQAA